MADTNGANGSGLHRNHFGALPTQELHPDIADKVLSIIKERHPYVFGSALAEAMTGVRFSSTAPRERHPAAGTS